MMNVAKRSLRLLRIGWNAAKLRASVSETERTLARQSLANLFSDARGTAMKIGQLLAQDENSPFGPLLDKVQPIPLADIGPYIEESMGITLDSEFQEFDEASAAASLGQVHHARLLDGEEVAVKVRYPGIADTVAAEMKIVGLFPGVGPVKTWGFDLDSYKCELKSNMERELDYLSEAARQHRFRESVSVQGLVVPRIFQRLCSERVLVQSWETGGSFYEILRWPDHLQHQAGVILLQTLFKSVFSAGLVHADPHVGNYFFRCRNDIPEVVIMDFGCTVELPEHARTALLALIVALKEKRDISPAACFTAMGFDAKKLDYIAPQLPMLSKILFRPFLEDTKFNFSYWRLKDDLASLLEDKRWWFRSAGPANLLLLMRAFQGVIKMLEDLRLYASWWEILRTAVSDDMLDRARKRIPTFLGKSIGSSGTMNQLARDLKVRVTENGRQIVAVSMPADAALDLQSLIPQDTLSELVRLGSVNLHTIEKRIRETGLSPQILFEASIGAKQYRVWLE